MWASFLASLPWSSRSAPAGPTPRSPAGQERLALELEALHAAARVVADGGLIAGARQVLSAVCEAVRLPAGLLYRVSADGRALLLLAAHGVPSEETDDVRTRAIDPVRAAEAVGKGRFRLGDLLAPGMAEGGSRAADVVKGWNTEVAVPIELDGQLLGALSLGAPMSLRALGGHQLRLLQDVAAQLAVALSRQAVQAANSETARRLEMLTQLSRALTTTLSLDQVLQRVTDAATELFGAGFARLWLLEESADLLVLRAESGVRSVTEESRQLRIGEGLVGAAALARAPVIVSDVLTDPRTRNAARFRAEGLVSLAAVPLVIGDRVLGVLAIAVRERHEYGADELAQLQSLANQAAVAIDNARLFTGVSARTTELAAVLEINTKIAGAASRENLLGAIAEEAARLLGIDNAGFRLLEGDELVLAGLAGAAGAAMLRPRIRVGESLSGRVVTEGRTICVSIKDVAAAIVPEHYEAIRRLGYTSFLGVPIRFAGRMIGVLSFRSAHPFTRRDQELAEAFAGQAAIAIEQSRLHAESTRQAEQMKALAELGRLLSETLDPDAVARRAAQSLLSLFAARGALVCRLEAGTGDMVAVATAGDIELGSGEEMRFEKGTGLVALAGRERAPVASADVLNDARVLLAGDIRGRVERTRLRALLAVPLIVKEAVVGVLAIADEAGRIFGRDEVQIAEAFADQTALAIENAGLYAEARRRQREAEELAQIARTLTESLDISAVGERIVQSLQSLFHSRSSTLRLLDPDGSLVALAFSGEIGSYFTRGYRTAPGYGLVARALAASRPVWSVDVLMEPGIQLSDEDRARIATSGNRALLVVPLRVGERTVGVLTVGDLKGRAFTEDDVRLAQALADQAALAIDNAGLLEETDRRRREAEVMADVARTINASLDLGAVLDRVAAAARDLCASDIASIALRDPGMDALTHRYWVGARSNAWGASLVEPGKGTGGQVLRSGRAFRTAQYAEDSRFGKEYLQQAFAEGIVAEMVVPVFIGESIDALLYVHHRSSRSFTDRDESILLRLAEHTSVAIRNARLYEALEVRATRLRSLARLNEFISSSLDTDEVLAAIARAATEVQMGKVPLISFWVADEGSRMLRLRAVSDPSIGADIPAATLAYGDGLVGWVAEHRERLHVPDVSAPGSVVRQAEWLLARGLRSVLAIPVLFQDSLLAVIALAAPQPLDLDADVLDVIESFVAQAGVAIRNARLYEETRRRLEHTRALLDVADILNSTLRPKLRLKRVAIKAAKVCHVDRCSLELWDGSQLTPLMSQFADGRKRPAMWDRFNTIRGYHPGAVPAHARAIETRRPVVVDDTAQSDLIPGEWAEAFSLRSYLIVPLVRQDRVIGVMNLDCCERSVQFQRWQVELAMAIAGQIALALENTRLDEEVQARLRETTTLLAVGRVLSAGGPTHEMMRRVARELGKALGADTVGVHALNEQADALVPLAGYHVPPRILEILLRTPFVIDRMPRPELWRQAAGVWSSDAGADPRFDAATFAEFGPMSVAFAPTLVKGQAVGAIFVLWWRTGRQFTPAEIRLVEGVASHVGLALENAELARQTEAKLGETETLLATSRALSSTLDLDAILREMMRRIAKAVDAESVGVWTVVADGQWMEPLSGYRLPPQHLMALRQMRLPMVGEGFYPAAIRARHPVFSALGSEDPQIPPDIRESAPHQSQLFVPIAAQERVIGGVVAVWWARRPKIGESELGLVDGIANQAGVALENARLFGENRRKVEELSVLYELSQAVTGQLDRSALVDAILTQMTRVLGVEEAMVALRGEHGDELHAVLDRRAASGTARVERDHAPGVGLVAAVMETHLPVRTTDYLGECVRRAVEPVDEGDGGCHWVGVPVMGPDSILGVLAVRRAEGAFSEHDERLLTHIAGLGALALRSARLYEERSRAYTELSTAQDELLRTEKLRALGEMASGVAHDFNNLLASILGRAQLLLQRVTDPQASQWLKVIERAALDGAQTVRQLQEFTRTRRDESFAAVDLNQVVRDALDITQSRWSEDAHRRGVPLDVRTELGDIPTIAGDAVELRETLTNLILNALDAMPSGGALTIGTAAVDGRAEVRVSDTGVGIPETVRDKIFNPFFTTKGPKGTGLGLSITYGIVSRHNGEIIVDSQEGRGTTFTLSFPASADTPAVEASAVPGAATVRSLRCLVVDDEVDVGEVLGDVLEAGGHRVVVLADAVQALDRFRAEAFDLVFTDLAMPGMSGWQVAEEVKRTRPDVPVVMMTGFVELSAKERAAKGVDAVLVKPVKIEDILEVVARLAQRAERQHREERDVLRPRDPEP